LVKLFSKKYNEFLVGRYNKTYKNIIDLVSKFRPNLLVERKVRESHHALFLGKFGKNKFGNYY
jgi:hypothetical protein